jgi:hypothetical protein
MVVRLRLASRPTQVFVAKWVAAWGAASSEVEGAPTEAEAVVVAVAGVQAEAHAGVAWKPIDQLS